MKNGNKKSRNRFIVLLGHFFNKKIIPKIPLLISVAASTKVIFKNKLVKELSHFKNSKKKISIFRRREYFIYSAYLKNNEYFIKYILLQKISERIISIPKLKKSQKKPQYLEAAKIKHSFYLK